jgi:hypothetical protein
MRTFHLLLIICIVFAACRKDDAAASVENRMQGTWRLVTWSHNEPNLPMPDTPWIMRVSGNIATIYQKNAIQRDTFHIAYDKYGEPCYVKKGATVLTIAVRFDGNNKMSFLGAKDLYGADYFAYERITDELLISWAIH